jgi:hypothetical protein
MVYKCTSYDVHRSVPVGIFDVFARSVERGTKVAVTKENAGAFSLLAKEFWLEDLLSACSALQIASVRELRKPESISSASHLMS